MAVTGVLAGKGLAGQQREGDWGSQVSSALSPSLPGSRGRVKTQPWAWPRSVTQCRAGLSGNPGSHPHGAPFTSEHSPLPRECLFWACTSAALSLNLAKQNPSSLVVFPGPLGPSSRARCSVHCPTLPADQKPGQPPRPRAHTGPAPKQTLRALGLSPHWRLSLCLLFRAMGLKTTTLSRRPSHCLGPQQMSRDCGSLRLLRASCGADNYY